MTKTLPESNFVCTDTAIYYLWPYFQRSWVHLCVYRYMAIDSDSYQANFSVNIARGNEKTTVGIVSSYSPWNKPLFRLREFKLLNLFIG